MLIAVSKLERPDVFLLVGYFVLMLGIGAYFYRYMRGMKDYFSGGNRIPWWLSGVSFYMSCFSVFGFVVYSALGFQYGWLPVTAFWAYIPGTLLSAFLFGPRWRRARVDSPVEYLEMRYSSFLRQLCAWQGVPVKIIDDALKLVAIGIFFSVSLGLDRNQSMLWSGLIMLAYTFMGGLWAVAVTDFVQFIVMGAAVLILFPLALFKAGLFEAGGFANFAANVPEGFFRPVSGEYGWIYIASLVFLFSLALSSVHWQLVQRYTCVRNEKEAHRVGWLVTVLHFVTPVIMFVPAMVARQFLPTDINPEAVYPTLCTVLLPTGLLGLMIAAMFAATMSMLSSDYNVCAAVLTNDVYRRLIRPEASQKELVVVGRLMTLLIGLIALGTAFLMAGKGGDDLFKTMVALFSVATAPVAVPMLLGLVSRRINSAGATAGFVAGLGLGIVLFFLLDPKIHFGNIVLEQENVLLISTATTTAVVMMLVSWLVPRSEQETQRAKLFARRLSTEIGGMKDDPLPPADDWQEAEAISPFRVVGVSIGIIGLMMLAVVPFVDGKTAIGMNLGIALVLVFLGVLMFYRGSRRPIASALSSVHESSAGTPGLISEPQDPAVD